LNLPLVSANARELLSTKAATNNSNSTPESATSDGVADKATFLKLLVSQIKHQNPLDPSDGTEFVAQLAQFSQVEQLVNIRQDLDAIRTSIDTGKALA
jgi:flagellar basal-body rod modification protein FlgD